MFEEMTYESIMSRMLSRVSGSFDKREGSIIYDALAPAALELAQLYADLQVVLNQVFADTAEREYLARRAAERGLSPYEASNSYVKGVFNIAIEIGERFNLGEVNFETSEYLGEENGRYAYSLKCETAGRAGNVTGNLIPIDNISGLTYAAVSEILIYGDEMEDTEVFRKRYFDSINNIAFGGNIADYKAKVKAMDGVGGVKVYRADDWQGAGTVKIVITTTENTTPSDELISAVKEALDPSDREGEGVGLSPIGHIVTVVGAESKMVNVRCSLKTDGTNSDLRDDVRTVLKEYINEVNALWEENENAVFYGSHIIGKLIGVPGIIDVKSVYINTMESNLTLDADCIGYLGYIVIEEE